MTGDVGARGASTAIPFLASLMTLIAAILLMITIPATHLLVLVGVFGLVVVALWWGVHQLASFFLALTVFTASHTALRVSESISVSDVFLCLGALLLLPGLVTQWRIRLPNQFTIVVIGAAGILFGGLLGTIFGADSPVVSFVELSKFMVAIVFVPLVFILWRPTFSQVQTMLWVWLTGIVLSVLVSLVEQSAYQGRADGLTLHPNTLGLSAMFGAGTAIALVATRRGVARWVAFVALLLCVVGVVTSGSRAALGSLFVAMVVFLILTRQVRLIVGLGVMGFSSIGFLMSPLVDLPEGNALARLIASVDTSSSLNVVQSNSERQHLLAEAIQGWSEHPLTGTGFENATSAHNIFVQLGSSGGPIALLGYAVVVFAICYPLAKIFSRGGAALDGDRLVMIIGLISTILGFLAGGFFHNALWERYLWIVPALLIVLNMPTNDFSAGVRSHRRI